MEQPDLWSSTPEAPARDRDRWLAGIHAVAQWVISTAVFDSQVRAALTGGAEGEAFDETLTAQLTGRPDTPWTPDHVDGLGWVESVRWGPPPPRNTDGNRRLSDVTLHIDELAVPVNIKRAKRGTADNNACASSTGWKVALTGELCPDEPLPDPAKIRMALRAGRLELVPGEYLIMHVTVTGAGTDWSPAVTMQGLIGAVRADGRLASQLHRTSGRLTYGKAAGVVAPGADIEGMLADAWGPRAGSVAELREQLWLVARDRFPDAPPGRLETFAGLLVDLDDGELFSRLLSAVLAGAK